MAATTKVGCECVFGALTRVSCTAIAWPMQRMTRPNGLAQVPNIRVKIELLCCCLVFDNTAAVWNSFDDFLPPFRVTMRLGKIVLLNFQTFAMPPLSICGRKLSGFARKMFRPSCQTSWVNCQLLFWGDAFIMTSASAL